MYNGNPHAPTGEWLHAIAGRGGYEDSEEGDSGTDKYERGGTWFEVTVENLGPSPDGPVVVTLEDIHDCPEKRLDAEHYRPDGTCKCEVPDGG